MRFMHADEYKIGDKRVRYRKFLFLPRTMVIGYEGSVKETRWLEWASWCERRIEVRTPKYDKYFDDWYDVKSLSWKDEYWLNN